MPAGDREGSQTPPGPDQPVPPAAGSTEPTGTAGPTGPGPATQTLPPESPTGRPADLYATRADAAPAGAAVPLPQVPGYEVLEELGRGGMGVVYKARQMAARRLVALKVIRDGALAGPDQRARFRVEAEAAARFEHPNLVRIYEVGEHAGLPFFSMELAAGGGLDRRLAGRPLPSREAAELARTLADAVAYAHAKQVIHRDLKPANVVLTAEGRPLVTDFGLAKRLDSDTRLTPTEAVLGTANYMAPEQADGRARAVGPLSDVYSLGAILYELLTGRPPFKGESWHATVRQVVEDDPEPPARIRPGVPAELEAVCLKCLEKEPARRYAGAAELADDLGRWLRGEPPAAAPVPEWERQARWARDAGFEVEELLTVGVRDVVYRARQVHLNRPVALKVVAAPGPGDGAARDRLRREAETVARLDHPNIVRIHSSGELRGRTYLAFEYIAGGNLIERFVDRALPPAEAVRLVRPLADAMRYAHERGVLHCALKPSNVLLTPDGTPKITNFGLSVLRDEPATERRPAFRRLPSYLAPELAEGRPADVGPATDVYALGAILYKLLTGGPPFMAGTLAETLEQVRSQPPRPPSSVRPEVPPELDAVCLRCLEKDPGRRYADAGGLAQALAAFGEGPADAPTAAGVVRVGDYELGRELGRGSLTIVYEARHLATGRPVALKLWQPDFRSGRPTRSVQGRPLRALLREVAEELAGLRHPHVVEVYECGEHDGRPFFTMELLPGGSLERRSAGAQQAPAEAAALVRTLARALDVAHGRGIVHGNLKPSKVLFTADGTPKLTGFIAGRRLREAAGEQEMVTMAAPAVMGNPRYMAPEQLTGGRAALGPATDLHALGLILYELLTGWHPYRAATLWEMLAQLREPPEPPSRLRPDVPRDLEALCLRCLEKDPARRHPSAAALADDLDRFLAGQPVPVPAPPGLTPAASASRPGWRARLLGWGRRRSEP